MLDLLFNSIEWWIAVLKRKRENKWLKKKFANRHITNLKSMSNILFESCQFERRYSQGLYFWEFTWHPGTSTPPLLATLSLHSLRKIYYVCTWINIHFSLKILSHSFIFFFFSLTGIIFNDPYTYHPPPNKNKK